MSKTEHDAFGGAIDVSVIVANYNGERFIAEAIHSVCEQSLRCLEIIVCDDASMDGSVDIVKQIAATDDRIRLVSLPRNEGPAAARNRALDVARGRWIAIMDSDDLLHPDRLATLVHAAEGCHTDIIADDLLAFESDGRSRPYPLLRGKWAREAQWVTIEDYVRLNNFYGRGPALGYLKPMFRRALIDAGRVRYDERLRIAEDYDFVFRLVSTGAKFRTIPWIGYFYRRHSGSISHRLNPAVLKSILEVERGRDQQQSLTAVAPVLRARERSVGRALAFEKLVNAIKGRQPLRALAIAARNPGAAALLRLPIRQMLARVLARPQPTRTERLQICVLSRQRIVGRTNGSSRYLLDIVEYLRGQAVDVHLIVPSPVTLGRWPFLRLSDDMAIFKSIKIRGTLRIGRYIVTRDPRVVIRGVLGLLDRVLYRAGVISTRLSHPAPYAVSQPLTRADQLFLAKETVACGDVQIADYCFLTEAFAFTLRPDARRLVIMHDLFSSRSDRSALATLSLKEEVQMLARAETILAIQRDEAAVLQRELPAHQVIVVPMAATAVSQAVPGRSETILFVGSSAGPNVDGIRWFLEACWPTIRQNMPNVELQIAGSVCNALATPPSGVQLLNVVDDLDDLYAEAGVVISPLRLGSGLKIKLIEALSKGKAVVATTTTMQGVMDVLGACAIIEDDADRFASSVIALLADTEQRRSLGSRGIAAITAHFSPQHCYGAILPVLRGERRVKQLSMANAQHGQFA
ncbi:glycosyltransferase [Bradyrhizobium sp. STM 3809]|uniref:glycosyltransferase n=1 Tax=Bradyrhizobium sp. STM 3809 TaxID=551936 RepID=UPI0002408888|nr:glycosyltransferase [Bradyrhizobium sp. STM 3809]CCE00261.1 putative Succinoglycan biosynthesis protein ExoO-like [Bradyrhizobium sp. STM 3809]